MNNNFYEVLNSIEELVETLLPNELTSLENRLTSVLITAAPDMAKTTAIQNPPTPQSEPLLLSRLKHIQSRLKTIQTSIAATTEAVIL